MKTPRVWPRWPGEPRMVAATLHSVNPTGQINADVARLLAITSNGCGAQPFIQSRELTRGDRPVLQSAEGHVAVAILVVDLLPHLGSVELLQHPLGQIVRVPGHAAEDGR